MQDHWVGRYARLRFLLLAAGEKRKSRAAFIWPGLPFFTGASTAALPQPFPFSNDCPRQLEDVEVGEGAC